MALREEIEVLYRRQMVEWPEVSERYSALPGLKRRTATISPYGRARIKLVCNPMRSKSTLADLSREAIKMRPCFLCAKNLPPEQGHVMWTGSSGNSYRIQVNPYPITQRHFTIVAQEHVPQLIRGRWGDLHELARLLPDYAILYNGPHCGASAPDHFHFQAVPKDELPLTQFYLDEYMNVQVIVGTSDMLALYSSNFWCRNLSFTTDNATKIELYCSAFIRHLPRLSDEQEPKFNIVAWTDEPDTDPIVTILPRRKHRANNYGPGKGHYLVSPGVIDMAGLITFVDEAQLRRISYGGAWRLLLEVSVDNASFDNAIDKFRKTKL